MIHHVKTALVLAPHADDGELGCGGTLARLVEQDTRVCYVAFSICEESVPTGFPRDILATELLNATHQLGITRENVTVLRYRVRRFTEKRQEILENLVRMRHQIQPDLVFLPAGDDVHQDHAVIAQEGVRAFKYTSILGYELPWNNVAFAPNVFIRLEERHVTQKKSALAQYHSQYHRNYVDAAFIHSLARVRGVQAKVEYAEGFQGVRWIMR